MLKLCGFAVSNYYNRVKLALLEKNIPFTEELIMTSQDPAMLKRSPMGKVPFLETPQGILCESGIINEYLEDAYPPMPLFPTDLFAKAKVREMYTVIDLYLELPARRLYPQAFFGGTISEQAKEQAKKELEKGVRTLQHLASWKPFIVGEQLSYADLNAFTHLPLVSMATKIIYGSDMLEAIPQIKPYLQMLKTRPHFQKVEADRKAGVGQMDALRKKA